MTDRKPRGYWENFVNVEKELRPLLNKYGRFPSNNEMTKEGKTSLARFIGKYHGGILEVAKRLNASTYDEQIGRNKANTWNESNVTIQFKEYVRQNKIDYFPSRYEISKNGSNIYIGITQVFGSYKNFKKHLKGKGFSLKEKPKDVKWTFETAVNELEPIINEIGYFPSQSDLDRLNLKGLRGYISKNNLLDALKKHFDVQSKLRKNTVSRPSGYWNNHKNVLLELDKVFNKFGRIPTNKELLELGFGSLALHVKKLPKETLEKYNYFSNSILIKTKDGHFVRSNYELLFDNYLSFNNLIHQTEGIIAEGHSKKYQFDFKLTLSNKKIVFVEIWGYTRNRNKQEKNYHQKRLLKESFYKSLKLNLIGIPADIYEKSFEEIYNYFSKAISKCDKNYIPKEIDINYFLWGSTYNEENLIESLRILISLNQGYFPTTNELRGIENGEGIISQIQKFGGVEYFKNKLNVTSKLKESKWSLEYLKAEINNLNKLLYMPSYEELNKLNRLDIFGGIQRNGGFKKVAKALQIPTFMEYLKKNPKPSKSKWTKEYLFKELKLIIKQFNKIPSETELIKMGRGDLVFGIKKNGGFVEIKKIIEVKPNKK
jgi:ribosomal protein L24E